MEWATIKNEVRFSAVRSRGPGGQNVNKVSSAALLFWEFELSSGLSTGEKTAVALKLDRNINQERELYLRSDEYRDLPRNKSRCLEKLHDLLTRALFKPKPRRATKPTRASKVRKEKSKIKRSEVKKWRQKVRGD